MKTSIKIIKWSLVVLVAIFLAMQFIRPVRSNPAFTSSQSLETHTQMTPDVAAILDRSCNDCHSNNTRWPWYSNVAPVSWFVIDHVNHARSHLNFSEWGTYQRDDWSGMLGAICKEVESGSMPLSSYRSVHRRAKLTAEDKKLMCDWVSGERARLASSRLTFESWSSSCFTPPVQYNIRPLTPADQSFLWEMLYQSLHVPAGQAPFERDILKNHDIAKYVKDWGRESDAGLVAVDENGNRIGAIWLRQFSSDDRGYGYVDDQTPEIGMAVLSEYRGRGVGTRLLSALVESVARVHRNLSLSVALDNPARRLYERFGFEVVTRTDSALVMQKKLGA